jgi:hypothetical protein
LRFVNAGCSCHHTFMNLRYEEAKGSEEFSWQRARFQFRKLYGWPYGSFRALPECVS